MSQSIRVRAVSGNELEQFLEEQNQPVLLYFSASWCGPCKAVSPVMDDIVEEAGADRVVKIDIDDQPDVAGQYSVRGVPTVILVSDGEEEARVVGARAKSVYEKLLAEAGDAAAVDKIVNPEVPELWHLLRDPSQLTEVMESDPDFLSRVDEFHRLTPLELAVRSKAAEAIELLLDAGAEPGIVELAGIGSAEDFRALSDRSPELLADEETREGCLLMACLWGRLDFVRLLLDASANPDGRAGHAPIIYAITGGEPDIMTALLEAGASTGFITQGDSDIRITPLHFAASLGKREFCEILLNFGADPTLERTAVKGDARPMTPVDDARQRDHEDVVNLLEEAMR